MAEYNIMRDDFQGFNILHNHASIVGGLDIGFNIPIKLEELELAYLLGADELPFDKLKSAFIIYQGHHGDAGAANADVILPAAAYTEQSGIYVNLEGRPQIAEKAVSLVGTAKEDIEIIKKSLPVI